MPLICARVGNGDPNAEPANARSASLGSCRSSQIESGGKFAPVCHTIGAWSLEEKIVSTGILCAIGWAVIIRPDPPVIQPSNDRGQDKLVVSGNLGRPQITPCTQFPLPGAGRLPHPNANTADAK